MNKIIHILVIVCGIFPLASHALNTSSVLVIDGSNTSLFSKNAESIKPIASITKLMTAMVVLDANLYMDELITITEDDVDNIRHSHSRLGVGTVLSRNELLRLALMSSDNRAAHALARTYPGNIEVFIPTMNAKCQLLGMNHSQFYDPTGLTQRNTSTATDLAKMVSAASQYATIRTFSTTKQYEVNIGNKPSTFNNTNKLVKEGRWNIELSKTGYIVEAGKCLVMKVKTISQTLIIVLLDSKNSKTRIDDAVKVKRLAELNFH